MTLIINVDGCERARNSRSRILKSAGFTVVNAASGHDGLQAVNESVPALVILAVDLPDIAGVEMCRRIKARWAEHPVLVMRISAGSRRAQEKIISLESGADSYLCEPIGPDELVASVRALLRLHVAEKTLRDAQHYKDCFLATLPHELRNPFVPIRNALQLLGTCNGPSGIYADAHRIASRQVKHLGRLVDDLLDLSRVSNGTIVLQKELVDLRPCSPFRLWPTSMAIHSSV
ncbi:hybrid sensor histidine kinase/response regulator [Paraburkholderia bannensis]|uniref:hybrid sensor histidine kinase/response regulator n=1 Tax=Paraburkholderia bannensis TaxID=765414 RepID=UPI000A002A74|nr:response regulator [Paraburkholderia bannensis]